MARGPAGNGVRSSVSLPHPARRALSFPRVKVLCSEQLPTGLRPRPAAVPAPEVTKRCPGESRDPLRDSSLLQATPAEPVRPWLAGRAEGRASWVPGAAPTPTHMESTGKWLMGQVKTNTPLSWVLWEFFPHASSEETLTEKTVSSQMPQSGAAHTHLGQRAAPGWFGATERRWEQQAVRRTARRCDLSPHVCLGKCKAGSRIRSRKGRRTSVGIHVRSAAGLTVKPQHSFLSCDKWAIA